MIITGKYAASNIIFQQGLILDTDKKCFIKTKKLFHLFDVSDKCIPLPRLDYILMFRTLYAKCEPCSTEDFKNSSTVQLSLVYNKNRRLIIDESKDMAKVLEKAKSISGLLHLKIRDSATDRRNSTWLS